MIRRSRDCPKKLGLGLFLSVFLVFSQGVSALADDVATPTPGPILQVGKEKEAKYSTIQAAIDAAPEGATVQVGPGEYEEYIAIRKPLVIEGAGWDKTTIVEPQMTPEEIKEFREAWETLNKTLPSIEDKQKREALGKSFQEKYFRRALLVQDARGVQIRNLKITSARRSTPTHMLDAIVRFERSDVQMTGCAVLGSQHDGINIADRSKVEIRNCLVAAAWGTGIAIGMHKEPAVENVKIVDCEVRNCYYAGILIRKGNHASVERCRVSGAAWHGIRYDDTSPTIVGNAIFGNARCGIYASGKTAATVRGNLFAKNGMACFYENRDTIRGNTFVGNSCVGMAINGNSKVSVERNIFFDHSTAIACNYVAGDDPAASIVSDPQLSRNLFWKNKVAMTRATVIIEKGKTVPSTKESKEVELGKETESQFVDPGFKDAAGDDFSLSADSPARRDGIGAADCLTLKSPWALQPEEEAIIPDGTTRDSNAWKDPSEKARKEAMKVPRKG
jgi:hypothetical protein